LALKQATPPPAAIEATDFEVGNPVPVEPQLISILTQPIRLAAVVYRTRPLDAAAQLCLVLQPKP